MAQSTIFPPAPPPTANKEQIYQWDTALRREMVARIGITNDRMQNLLDMIEKKGLVGGGGGGTGTAVESAKKKDEKKFLAQRTFTDVTKIDRKNIKLTKEELDMAYQQIMKQKGAKLRLMMHGVFGGMAGQSPEEVRKAMIEGVDKNGHRSLFGGMAGGSLLQKYLDNGSLGKWLEDYKRETIASDEKDALEKMAQDEAQNAREADFRARNGIGGPMTTPASIDGVPATAVVSSGGGFYEEIAQVRDNTHDMLEIMTDKPSALVGGGYENMVLEYMNMQTDIMKKGFGAVEQAMFDLNTESLTNMVEKLRGFNEATFPVVQLGEKTLSGIQRAIGLAIAENGGGGGGGGLMDMADDILDDVDMPDRDGKKKKDRKKDRKNRNRWRRNPQGPRDPRLTRGPTRPPTPSSPSPSSVATETLENTTTQQGEKQVAKEVGKQGGKQVAKEAGKQVAKQGGKQVAKEAGKQVAKQGAKIGARALIGRGAGAVAGVVGGAVAGVVVASAFTGYELWQLGKAINEYREAKNDHEDMVNSMNANTMSKATDNFEKAGPPYWIGTSDKKIQWLKKNRPQVFEMYKNLCVAEATAQVAMQKYNDENDFEEDEESKRLKDDWTAKMKARVAFKKKEIDSIPEPDQQPQDGKDGAEVANAVDAIPSPTGGAKGSGGANGKSSVTTPTATAMGGAKGSGGVNGINGVGGANGLSSMSAMALGGGVSSLPMTPASGGLVNGASTTAIQTSFGLGGMSMSDVTEAGQNTRMLAMQKFMEEVLIPKLSDAIATKSGNRNSMFATNSAKSASTGGGGNTPHT